MKINMEKRMKIQNEFTEKLFNDFPDLFRQKDNPRVSLMSYGVCCDKGWYDLIYNLTKQINNIVQNNSLKGVEVVQIKEKFGGLRYYMHNTDKEMIKFIRNAEQKSYEICERCGKKATKEDLSTSRWIRTLCETCRGLK